MWIVSPFPYPEPDSFDFSLSLLELPPEHFSKNYSLTTTPPFVKPPYCSDHKDLQIEMFSPLRVLEFVGGE